FSFAFARHGAITAGHRNIALDGTPPGLHTPKSPCHHSIPVCVSFSENALHLWIEAGVWAMKCHTYSLPGCTPLLPTPFPAIDGVECPLFTRENEAASLCAFVRLTGWSVNDQPGRHVPWRRAMNSARRTGGVCIWGRNAIHLPPDWV